MKIENIVQICILKSKGMSHRDIAGKLGLSSASAVSRALDLVIAAGMKPERVPSMDPSEVAEALSVLGNQHRYMQPVFEDAYQSTIRRENPLTLKQYHDESYKRTADRAGLEAYSYKHFCRLFDIWLSENHGSRAITEVPCQYGDLLEVDFAGGVTKWHDCTGTFRSAHVFSACLRASGLVYFQAFDNEKTQSWLAGIQGCLETIGGSPRAITVDNAAALVKRPDKFVGEVSAALNNLANYYGIEVHTSKVRRPTYKSETERAVHLYQAKILPLLVGDYGRAYARDLDELNSRIAKLTDRVINRGEFRNSGTCTRQYLFETHERAELKPLPCIPYERSEWQLKTVSDRGLVTIGRHKYSAHFSMRGKQVMVCLGATTITLFDPKTNAQVGAHERDYGIEGRTHINQEDITPAEKSLRMGEAGYLAMFTEAGYDDSRILRAVKAFATANSAQMVIQRREMGLLNMCRKYGGETVARACDDCGYEMEYRLIKALCDRMGYTGDTPNPYLRGPAAYREV